MESPRKIQVNQRYNTTGKYGFMYRKEVGTDKQQLTSIATKPKILSTLETLHHQPSGNPRLPEPAGLGQGQGEVGVSHNVTRGQVGVGHQSVTGQREAGNATLRQDSGARHTHVNGREDADAMMESSSAELDDVDMPGSPILPYTQPLGTTSASIRAHVEIERNLEMEKFTAELKKMFKSQDGLSVATDIDSSVDLFIQDLEKSGLYYQYLESEDPTLVSHELKERIELLRATIDLYKRELREWDEMTEQKRLGVEDAKLTFESERDVDFSQLHCDDVETLKSYLTPTQTAILDEPVLATPLFGEESMQQLQAIDCKLEAELKRIQNHCRQVNSVLKLGNNTDAVTAEDTPRTLFKALKHHQVNS